MPALIELAAVDSGGGRRWHFGASPLGCQPGGVQSPLPAMPYIRQTLGLLPTKHHCSTSFLVLHCTRPTAKWLQSVFVTVLSPGSRLAYGRLACHRAFAVEFSSCGAQSPEEVSGVPTSQPHIRCTRGVKGVLCNRFRETRAFLGIASPWWPCLLTRINALSSGSKPIVGG